MSFHTNRAAQLEATAASERLLGEDYTVKAKVASNNGNESLSDEYNLMAALCFSQATEAEQQKRELNDATHNA